MEKIHHLTLLLILTLSSALIFFVNCHDEDETTTQSTLSKDRGINLFIINDENDMVANISAESALNDIQTNHPEWLGNVTRILINSSEDDSSLSRICVKWDTIIQTNDSDKPDLVLDFTKYGAGAQVVQRFTALLGIPTITTQYGEMDDLVDWTYLLENQKKYLVQIMPPGDLVPTAIRRLTEKMNISNAAVIFGPDFMMHHKYKSLLLNVPTRHVIVPAKRNSQMIDKQLRQLRDLDLVNYFVLGDENVFKEILNAANAKNYTGRKYGWYAFTLDDEIIPKCDCNDISVLFFKPIVPTSKRQRLKELIARNALVKPYVSSAFYYDITRLGIQAMRSAVRKGTWPVVPHYITCALYEKTRVTPNRTLILLNELKEITNNADNFQSTFGDFEWGVNNIGEHSIHIDMNISMVTINNNNVVGDEGLGTWKAGINTTLELTQTSKSRISNHTAVTSFRIVTVQLAPFMMKNITTGEWSGYCMDLINQIKDMMQFEYEIHEAYDGQFGSMDENGNWNGMIQELIDKRADIALGALSVMAERENVVDFTVPYYDLVGISILMLKPKPPTSLFKFLTVLEDDVWLCILTAYFFTSFLMWIFDRWSPASYQNNKKKYESDSEKREFDFKECLWFCMTSLTPQGGGEAPKNISGRLVSATWWLFGFIIIASYTANLAAFLTVSRLEVPIESLDDLSKQYKIQYAPVEGSEAYTYFKRMAGIEKKFYEIWKDMSLNESLTPMERAKLAVWDYPVSNKYTKMFQAMAEAGFPKTREAAVARVRKQLNESSASEFAFIGDATAIRYLSMTTCDLNMVGDEFSRKPYAIAVQQGSPLKDQLNNAILRLLNKRKLEYFKNKWWNKNENKKNCAKDDNQSDGISIQNIGGVFIVIFVGIFLACSTLIFEYWWFRYRPRINAEAARRAARHLEFRKIVKPMKFNMMTTANATICPTRTDFTRKF